MAQILDFVQAEVLRRLVRKEDVILLRASELAQLFMAGKLISKNRKDLQREQPQAFASALMVEQCLREVQNPPDRRAVCDVWYIRC